MTLKQLTERVSALEAELAELKQKLPANEWEGNASPQTWLKTSGRFKDDPLFDEVVEAGQKIRDADRKHRKKHHVSGK